MTVFESGAFYDALADIEKYLGYLKANELAFDYLHEALMASTGTTPAGDELAVEVSLDESWRFPCPDHRFQVQLSPGYRVFRVHTSGGTESRDQAERWVKEVQAEAERVYQQGLGWAAGFADYANTLVEQITKPSAFALDSNARSLKTSVVDELLALHATEWSGIGGLLASWHGDSKGSFSLFYNSTSGLLVDLGYYTAYVYAGMCAVTKIVAGTQNGLMNYVESARTGVVDQLQAWVENGAPPQDPPRTPQWVAKVESIGAKSYALLSHLPVVSTVTDAVGTVTTVASEVTDLAIELGWQPPSEQRPFDAKDCEQLYHEITTALRVDYLQRFQSTLQAVVSVERPDGSQLDGKTADFNPTAILGRLHKAQQSVSWQIGTVKDGSLVATTDASDDTDHDGIDDNSIYQN